MASILTNNAGLECLQLPDVMALGDHNLTVTSVFDTDTTQNGTYNDEPAYEGNGYWVFKSGDFWCKAENKTANYWEADAISYILGGFGSDNDNNSTVGFSISDGTTNYFGGFISEQTVEYCSDLVVCNKLMLPKLSICCGGTLEFECLSSMAASFTYFVNGSCKVALPTTQITIVPEGDKKQAKFEHGIIIGGNNSDPVNGVTYADNDFESGSVGCVENHCQVLTSVGQANSVCQLKADEIKSQTDNTVNADEVIYHSDYVRTSVNSGTSFPESPSDGDLFYRTDRRCVFIYDGTNWLVPTEGFPKYSHNDWDAFKLAWGKIIPKYESVSFNEPKITELSGTYGDVNSSSTYCYRWWCANLIVDSGKILVLPVDEDWALTLDPDTDSVVESINCSSYKGLRSSAYYEGKVYAYSTLANRIVKLDPSANTIIPCSPADITTTHYGGIVFNDYIYWVHGASDSMLKYNPSDNTYETFTNTGNSFANNTQNMALGPDNCFYIPPYRSDNFILKFDPFEETWEEITIDLPIASDDKRWVDFVLGPDGIFYIAPTDTSTSECGAYFNPITLEWGELTGYQTSTGDAFMHGISHPSGKIVWAPGGITDSFLILDTKTKTTEKFDKTASMTSGQKFSQLAPNGNIYMFPRYDFDTDVNKKIWKVELGAELPVDVNFVGSIYRDM